MMKLSSAPNLFGWQKFTYHLSSDKWEKTAGLRAFSVKKISATLNLQFAFGKIIFTFSSMNILT